MAGLPPERDAVLNVHADAVPPGLLPLQGFKSIAGRDRKVLQPSRRIEQLELPLNHAPQLAGNSSSGTRVSFSKQVCGRVI